MMRLGRHVRFSVNPFLDHDETGANAYASKPAGEGLAVFLELHVEIAGPVQAETGFVVNVNAIDRVTRQFGVPVFAESMRACFRRGEHIGLDGLVELLQLARQRLGGQFTPAEITKLTLKLNPCRTIAMETHDPGTVYLSEKFEFAAMHTLWNDAYSERENFEVFGKCANPTGHGHNYLVEVTIKAPAGQMLRIGDFQRVVDGELIALVDHKNLNLDIPDLQATIPTVENLVTFAWSRLVEKFKAGQLHCVTMWESDRTYCSTYG